MGLKEFNIEFQKFVVKLNDPEYLAILVCSTLWTQSVDIYRRHMPCNDFEDAQAGLEKLLGKTAKEWIAERAEKFQINEKSFH